jgi:hypothetical protein
MYGPTTYGARPVLRVLCLQQVLRSRRPIQRLGHVKNAIQLLPAPSSFPLTRQSLPLLTGGVSTLAPTPASDSGSSGLGTGAIIGIIVAGLVFLIAVGLGAYLLVTWKKGQGDHKAPASSSRPNDKSDMFELPLYDTTPKAGGERRTLRSGLVVMFAPISHTCCLAFEGK